MAYLDCNTWSVPVPPGLHKCRWCGGPPQYVEAANDWDGRGVVVRIGCLCDESSSPGMEKDDSRTSGFDPMPEAIAEWNAMNAPPLPGRLDGSRRSRIDSPMT